MSETGFAILGLAREPFFDTAWEQSPVLTRGGLGCPTTAVVDVQDVSRLVSTPGVTVSVVAQGLARPVEAGMSAAVFDAYASGSTLLLTGVELVRPTVAEICRALEMEFWSLGVPLAGPVTSNIYLTPPCSRGFDLHYDNHCAFVVQISGSKDWQVFPPLDELPLVRCEAPIQLKEVGPPRLTTTVQSGDVLYIPRGFPHRAESTTESSLHITFKVSTVTLSDLAHDAAVATAALRRSLPPIRDLADEDRSTHQVASSATLSWDLGEYRHRRAEQSLAALRPLPTDTITTIDTLSRTGIDTYVSRAGSSVCTVRLETGAAVLYMPGSAVRLPEVMYPVFRYIASADVFRPGDLPDVDGDYDKLELTKLLAARGLIVVAPPERAAERAEAGRAAVVEPREPHSEPEATRHDVTLVASTSSTAGRHLDWLHTKQLLAPADCDLVIKACLAFPVVASTTVDEGKHPGRRQVTARDVGLNDETRWFLEHLLDVAAEASTSHYGLRLSGLSRPPQYLEYRPGQGRFERHNDYSHDQAESPRKLTVIVQLSDPDEYAGGRLQVHGMETEELPSERGEVIVFPSFQYHSVTPVTRGLRRVFVFWVAGPRLI